MRHRFPLEARNASGPGALPWGRFLLAAILISAPASWTHGATSDLGAAARQYLGLLENFASFAEQHWNEKEGSYDASGSGVTWARGNGGVCLVNSVLLTEFPDHPLISAKRIPREVLLDHVRRTLRALCLKSKSCIDPRAVKPGIWGGADGSRGGHWQAGLETEHWTVAAQLLAPQLDEDTKALVRQVATAEADLAVKEIPSAKKGNTAADDCSWNAGILGVCAAIYADDPRAAKWDEWAKRWALNMEARESDRKSHRVIDGKPLGEWLVSVNVNPDLTLENHGFWDIPYQVSFAALAEPIVAYQLCGKKIPEAFHANAKEVGDEILKWLVLPDGDLLCPQGIDWAERDVQHSWAFSELGTLLDQPWARAAEARCLSLLARRQAVFGDGSIHALDFGYETDLAVVWSFSFLLHKLLGKADSGPGFDEPLGAKVFPHVATAVHRTPDLVSSVTWFPSRQAIMVSPNNLEALAGRPAFTRYDVTSGTGWIAFQGDKKRRAFRVRSEPRIIQEGGGLAVSFAREIPGLARQTISYCALPTGEVVVFSRWEALRDSEIAELVDHPFRWVEIEKFIGTPDVRQAAPGVWTVDGKLQLHVLGGAAGEIAGDGINGAVRRDVSAKAGDVLQDSVCVYQALISGRAPREARVDANTLRLGDWRIQRGEDGGLSIEKGTASPAQAPQESRAAPSQEPQAREITWAIPEDGGTPRDRNRIERIGPLEFRISASFEDGGQSVLRHAVSRLDLMCVNGGSQASDVTIHLDLSGDGKRTDYDSKPESGMKLRDFIFIQSPGKAWQQVDGSTERWVATVKFPAKPGETRLGLSPWYTYGDFLRFVNGLPNHPHLDKKLLARSDRGREQWELTITDPTVAREKKQTIFWQAREHAYETWSSFAMEGLVEFLLSENASEFRRRYSIVLHPMTNVDGVGQGFEYRGGYDFPESRGTATGRLTFDAIDRLRPDYAVAWHNWIAPRDRNVVFYTDGENDKPTARAWLRFTQLFPSLRGAGHRWKDEATPLKYNWQNRAPLSEGNPHEYAMKKHGTRVWGWEMPWWNLNVEDARRMGAAFARAFLTTLDELRSNSVPAATEQPVVEAPRWEPHEFSARGAAHVENPFRDASLVGEFVSPSGKTSVVDGFYDGDDLWRLRFAPDEEGDWSYLLRGEGVEILERGKLRCTGARGHGFIRLHPENPYAFAHVDGTPFFPMGDTCYGLHDDSAITPELRARYLQTRRAQHFNFVRMTVGHSEERAATDPNYWAWGGTPDRPDLDRLNPVFFRGFDELIRDLRAQGMNVELILLNFYRRPFTDTGAWTPTCERLWLRHVVSRYAAFDNIFLWTIANEYETHADGAYRLDYPADVDWAKASARFIKSNDSFHHLVTVHPVISASRRGENPRSPFDAPWRIGEFFGDDDAMDVLSQQTGQFGEGVVWDDRLQCWTGDSPTLVASLGADRRFKKPVLNTESGYEYLSGQPTEKRQVHHTDKVRRSAWRIVCAGGYFAAGFNGTIGHSDAWNRLDAPNHYTFIVRDEGAASQLAGLHGFFAALPFWRMQPFAAVSGDAVALAEPGRTYVVYLPLGGATAVDLSGAPGRFTARWFNPRTGELGNALGVSGGSRVKFDAPDTQDWALLLERRPTEK